MLRRYALASCESCTDRGGDRLRLIWREDGSAAPTSGAYLSDMACDDTGARRRQEEGELHDCQAWDQKYVVGREGERERERES